MDSGLVISLQSVKPEQQLNNTLHKKIDNFFQSDLQINKDD